MIRILKYIFSFLLLFSSGYGQDFHLSQYYSSPLTLNPAMTGMFNGNYRIVGNYRSQWGSITTPFVTAGISYDMKFNKFNGGLSIMNSNAGLGHLNIFNAELSGVYDLTLDSARYHHITFGPQIGIIQKGFDVLRLSFDKQYNYKGGGGYNTSAESGESFPSTRIYIPDLNFGMLWFYSKNLTRINPFMGASVLHITEPNESFFNAVSKLPRRYVGHAGAKINLHELFQITSQVLYMAQGTSRELTFSLLTHHYLVESNAFFIAGATYRNKDAVILHLGLKNNKFTYNISYDINTSSLYSISKGLGGIEFSVQYIGIILPANPIHACPRL